MITKAVQSTSPITAMALKNTIRHIIPNQMLLSQRLRRLLRTSLLPTGAYQRHLQPIS